MNRPHGRACDYGLTYADGSRGRCTCGAVTEELTADQLIRVIALNIALERHPSQGPDSVVFEAQTYETYIRGGERT